MYIYHNVLFSGDYISAFRGCCPFTFLHTLEIDQCLIAYTTTGTVVPPPKKKINRENLKIWLKMQRLSPDNFGSSDNILTKLFQATW